MTTRGRRAGSVLGAAALAAAPLVLAAPAHAENLDVWDATHDVRRWDPAAASGTTSAVPGRANGDLVRFSVDYDAHAIRIGETFRRLDRHVPVLAVGGTLQTPSGATHDLAVRAGADDPQGAAQLAGRPACAVEHYLDYAAGQATITIPAGCLGRPRWVRFQATTLTTDSWSRPSYVFVDVAPGILGSRTLSARVHRS